MMGLVHEKFVFVHVPKTGGTWVRSAIQLAGIPVVESGPFEIEDHYGICEMRAAHPELRGRFSFGFVRHPVGWLRSRWAWAKISHFAEKVKHNRDAQQHWLAKCYDDDFYVFIERYLERCPGVAGETMLGKLGYVKSCDGYVEGPDTVDYVGYFHELAWNLKAALVAAGVEFDAERLALARPQKVGASGRLGSQCEVDDDLYRCIVRTESPLLRHFYGLREPTASASPV